MVILSHTIEPHLDGLPPPDVSSSVTNPIPPFHCHSAALPAADPPPAHSRSSSCPTRRPFSLRCSSGCFILLLISLLIPPLISLLFPCPSCSSRCSFLSAAHPAAPLQLLFVLLTEMSCFSLSALPAASRMHAMMPVSTVSLSPCCASRCLALPASSRMHAMLPISTVSLSSTTAAHPAALPGCCSSRCTFLLLI